MNFLLVACVSAQLVQYSPTTGIPFVGGQQFSIGFFSGAGNANPGPISGVNSLNTVRVNSANDFCLMVPPPSGTTVSLNGVSSSPFGGAAVVNIPGIATGTAYNIAVLLKSNTGTS